MNYHRVIIQLMTWAIRISKIHEDYFHKDVIDKAIKSLKFLDSCIDPISGKTPNFGSNDGALFLSFQMTISEIINSHDLRSVIFGNTKYNSMLQLVRFKLQKYF